MKKQIQIQVAALIRYGALLKMWDAIGLNMPEYLEMIALGKIIETFGGVQ